MYTQVCGLLELLMVEFTIVCQDKLGIQSGVVSTPWFDKIEYDLWGYKWLFVFIPMLW